MKIGKMNERFHALVNKKLLGYITEKERCELQILSKSLDLLYEHGYNNDDTITEIQWDFVRQIAKRSHAPRFENRDGNGA